MRLFDVHAHLTHPELVSDVDVLLERARAAGVTSVISNGLNPTDNQAVLDLARRHPMVRPALGFYPVDAVLQAMRADGEDYPGQRETFAPEVAVAWVRDHVDSAFAIGEIGLDGYWVKERYWEQQEQTFRRLVELALAANKPIIIHTRKRERRALELLNELGARRVDWHCFGSRLSLARSIADAGHYLSIPANARRSESFTRMLQTLPRTQILLETDCPYLGPNKDERNEPANVRGTAEYAAEIWGTSLDDVAAQLAENYERLFGVSA